MFFRKLENHPDLKKPRMDEAGKFAELVEAKEQGMGRMLLEEMIARGEIDQRKDPRKVKKLQQIIGRSKKLTGKR